MESSLITFSGFREHATYLTLAIRRFRWRYLQRRHRDDHQHGSLVSLLYSLTDGETIQGRHDTRAPARQIEVYEEMMRARGKQIEILWLDSGHGFRSADEKIASQEQMLRFAYRALRQEGTAHRAQQSVE